MRVATALGLITILSSMLCLGEENVDKVEVFKAKRELHLISGDKVIRNYAIALGDQPVGHKQRVGDERTPEGLYTLDWRNNKSQFHLSLHISYPNERDKARAAKKGVSPGGHIMIHGLPDRWARMGDFHRVFDWTDGCIAVTNREIEEVWRMVADGTPIEIFP